MTEQAAEARGPTGACSDEGSQAGELESAIREFERTRTEIERLCQALAGLKGLRQKAERDSTREPTMEDARQILEGLADFEMPSGEKGHLASSATPSDWVPAWVLMKHEENFRRFLEAAATHIRHARERGATETAFLDETARLANRVIQEVERLSANDGFSSSDEYEDMVGIAVDWCRDALVAAFDRASRAWEDWTADPSEETESRFRKEVARAAVLAIHVQRLSSDDELAMEMFSQLDEWWKQGASAE
ncbi:MAG: hypothetical protein ACYTDY_00140 [Planctomycetota bacterium]|jgi:hypothetical protein